MTFYGFKTYPDLLHNFQGVNIPNLIPRIDAPAFLQAGCNSCPSTYIRRFTSASIANRVCYVQAWQLLKFQRPQSVENAEGGAPDAVLCLLTSSLGIPQGAWSLAGPEIHGPHADSVEWYGPAAHGQKQRRLKHRLVVYGMVPIRPN